MCTLAEIIMLKKYSGDLLLIFTMLKKKTFKVKIIIALYLDEKCFRVSSQRKQSN